MEIDLTQKIIEAKEKKVLNKPFRLPKGNNKKFGVYVKNEKGNIVIVKFGDPNMEIKRDDPGRRKNFRSRHNCSNPGPKWKARYWSCKMWEPKKSVTEYLKGEENSDEWDGEALAEQSYLLKILPSLSLAKVTDDEEEGGCGCDECDCDKSEGRSGPKSAAQTPAKPSERKKGSSKNKPGSAGTKPDAKENAEKQLNEKNDKELISKSEINFSERIIIALKNKVAEHNKKYSDKVTLVQLKKVYRRGAGAFSSSHRPGKTRGQWAMARVNMFLKMMRGGKVKDSYKKADIDIVKSSIPLVYDKSIEDELHFTVEDLLEAQIDIQTYCIAHDELYGFLDDSLFGEDDYSESAQKYFGGMKRSDLDDSDFLFPENRSFPIVTPQDVPDAISNFGRMSNKMSYNVFLRRLVKFLEKKGQKYMKALPEETKKRIKTLNASSDPEDHLYETKQEAVERASRIGLNGFHQHRTEDGIILYAPGSRVEDLN